MLPGMVLPGMWCADAVVLLALQLTVDTAPVVQEEGNVLRSSYMSGTTTK
jgi:hypothetical protein